MLRVGGGGLGRRAEGTGGHWLEERDVECGVNLQ